jgi:hypothetical protein
MIRNHTRLCSACQECLSVDVRGRLRDLSVALQIGRSRHRRRRPMPLLVACHFRLRILLRYVTDGTERNERRLEGKQADRKDKRRLDEIG